MRLFGRKNPVWTHAELDECALLQGQVYLPHGIGHRPQLRWAKLVSDALQDATSLRHDLHSPTGTPPKRPVILDCVVRAEGYGA